MTLTPFADDAASVTIGKLTVETGRTAWRCTARSTSPWTSKGWHTPGRCWRSYRRRWQRLEGEKGLLAAVPAPIKTKTVANPFE